jgi:ATP-binding cassette subfamily F protein 3
MLEEELSKTKQAKVGLENELGNAANYSNKDQYSKIEAEYKAADTKYKQLNEQYEKLFEELMELEGKL